ncbi:MAG: fibrinogen-like YCDxxxxGGGW domain-containing protein, partial [Bacteriovoracaceae bacterium]
QFYFNTTDNKLQVWDGDSWEDIGSGGGSNSGSSFFGSVKWDKTAACSWSINSTSLSSFPTLTDCDNNARTIKGQAVGSTNGAVGNTDGQKPQIKFSSMPAGTYLFRAQGAIRADNNDSTSERCTFLFETDGGLQTSGSFLDTISYGSPGEISGTLHVTSALTNPTIEIKAKREDTIALCNISPSISNFEISVFYFSPFGTGANEPSIVDDDNDTKIQVEESADEDKIRFDTAGAERAVIDSTGLTVTGRILQNGYGATSSNPALSCLDILNRGASTGNGAYWINPRNSTAFQVYCDMTTDGGGWTIVYATTGGTGEPQVVSNTTASGNPLSYQSFNLTQQQKVDISLVSRESIAHRNDNIWLKWDHPMFDQFLTKANKHRHYGFINIVTSDGTDTVGSASWSNFNTSQGGDFHVGEANESPNDHHQTNYYHLNSGCSGAYIYNYNSGGTDAGYKHGTGTLGNWTSVGCITSDASNMIFYMGMR